MFLRQMSRRVTRLLVCLIVSNTDRLSQHHSLKSRYNTMVNTLWGYTVDLVPTFTATHFRTVVHIKKYLLKT